MALISTDLLEKVILFMVLQNTTCISLSWPNYKTEHILDDSRPFGFDSYECDTASGHANSLLLSVMKI